MTFPKVAYRTVKIDGLDIFYREAGPKDAPTILLLARLPDLLADVPQPDPGPGRRVPPGRPGLSRLRPQFGPAVDKFDYTFDNLADVMDKFTEKVGLTKYALYVQDYGAPVGYRLAVRHPERVTGLVVQNGNAYDEGLDNDFWKPIKAYWKDRKREERRAAARFPQAGGDQVAVHPRGPQPGGDQPRHLDHRPGPARPARQRGDPVGLFYSYGSNPPQYPRWQEYFRKHQPPTLIVWGKNDTIFPPAGAEPYKRDLKTLEFHLLDTGHFALEEDGDQIADLMRQFLRKHAATK